MSSWTAGYTHEIDYTTGFYKELTPSILKTVTLAGGLAPPDGQINYCELGCGQGYSTNVLAAANPEIRFFANDFNPTHIVSARALATEAGNTNASFYDLSFEEFSSEPSLPATFQFICLHGIYSWISEANRKVIVEFIRKRLAPGGLVYISYNSLPGWAAGMPLRKLLVDASRIDGSINTRISAALGFVERFADLGSVYTGQTTGLADKAKKLREQNPKYIAHEYLNADWTPFYFSDVAAELAEAKLSFVSSFNFVDMVDILNFTTEQGEFLQSVSDVARRETLKDFLKNTQFRRDIFVKGTLTLSAADSRDLWLKQVFLLTTPLEELSLVVKGALVTATLHEHVYKPILAGFAGGAKTLREVITKNPDVAAINWPSLVQAVSVLVGLNFLLPAGDSPDSKAKATRARAFNKAVLRRAESSQDLATLASPVTGGGVECDRISMLFLAAEMARHADPVGYVWGVLLAQGQVLMKDGVAIATPEENIEELKVRYATYQAKMLPILKLHHIA